MSNERKEVRAVCENCGPIDPDQQEAIDWHYIERGGRCLVCKGKLTLEPKPKHARY